MEALIKSDDVVSEVKQMLRINSTAHDIWLNSLCETRARDLSTVETLKLRNCQVTVNNNKFYLPKDCKTLLMFRAQNSCIPGVFVDVPFLTMCGCTNQFWNPLRSVVNINERWVNFLNIVADGTIFEIAYQAVNTDENGDVVLNEEMYTALASWVAYKFALSYPENYTREQRMEWKTEGRVQGNRVRSLAARRKFLQERDQIRNLMTTVVNQSASFNSIYGNYTSFFYPTISQI